MLLVPILLSLILLAGCWNYRELNDLAIPLAIGVDEVPDRDLYRFSFQVVNARSIAGQKSGEVVPVVVYSSEGHTLLEAARKTAKKIPRRLNIQHVRDLIIGEKLARKGMEEIFDFMERDAEPRLTTRVFIAKNTDAESILKALTPIESIPGNAILGKLKTSGRIYGENYEVGVDDVIRGLLTKGGGPMVNGIKLTGNEEIAKYKSSIERTDVPAKLIVEGMALFKEGKLAGWAYDGYSRGISWVNNKIRSTIVSLDCRENKDGIAIEVFHTKTHISADFRGGQPIVDVRIRDVGMVGEVNCPSFDPSKSAELRKLEQQMNAKVEEEIVRAVKKVQTMHTDVLGFGEAIERANPKAWKEMENKWDTLFSTCEFNVHVESKLRRTGKITKPYLHELKQKD
ncbi:Ger(x)C family spore germination protein [Paenibacillus silvae]|uniref:Ger(X)C family spore germination protein n=2 Tax=Paenibacillus silvae TaxID=1325358 RepID=A0A2W6NNT3_9BACL|nr:Ger(x)C family spore germination protein [Paenibacillus silvae]